MTISINKYLWILIIFLGVLYALLPILTPFLVAALLAYLGDSLVARLEKRQCPRAIAVVLIFLAAFIMLGGILVFLLPLMEQQVSLFIEKLPEMVSWAKEVVLPWLEHRLERFSELDMTKLLGLAQAELANVSGGLMMSVVGSLGSSGAAVFTSLANMVLIPVVTFYLLMDWKKVLTGLRESIPRRMEMKTLEVVRSIDAVLMAFFKGQLMVMLALAVLYSLGLSLIGLEFALLIGLVAGLVSFVPYLGFVIGLFLACLASVFQLHDASGFLLIVVVFAVVQTLEGVVLTPVLVGDKIGLHPLAVIFAVMAGGHLFAFTGVLLALPVTAVLWVLLANAVRRYKQSELYQS